MTRWIKRNLGPQRLVASLASSFPFCPHPCYFASCLVLKIQPFSQIAHLMLSSFLREKLPLAGSGQRRCWGEGASEAVKTMAKEAGIARSGIYRWNVGRGPLVRQREDRGKRCRAEGWCLLAPRGDFIGWGSEVVDGPWPLPIVCFFPIEAPGFLSCHPPRIFFADSYPTEVGRGAFLAMAIAKGFDGGGANTLPRHFPGRFVPGIGASCRDMRRSAP